MSDEIGFRDVPWQKQPREDIHDLPRQIHRRRVVGRTGWCVVTGHPLSLLEAGVICDGLAAQHIHG